MFEDQPDRQRSFGRAFSDAAMLPDSDREDCGMAVARHVSEHLPEHLRPTEFVILSASAHRACITVADLNRAGYNAHRISYISLLPELSSLR